MEDFDKKIEGLARIKEITGPDLNFHDAEILSVNLERQGPSITVHVVTASIDDYSKSYLLALRFEGIEDVILEGFNHQNVIQGLVFRPQATGIAARFASLFGVELSFVYQKGRVVSVEETSIKCGHPIDSISPGR